MSVMQIHTTGGRRIAFPGRSSRRMVLLKLNTTCNLRCDYCWYMINPTLRVPVNEEMTSAEMIDVLREIDPHKGDVFYLSGGEPILREDVILICRHIREAGARVYLTTNGILRDRLLALASEIHGYVVSLDSLAAKLHDAHRGRHRTTVENIPHLVASRPVCVSVVLSKNNLAQLIPLADACINWGVQSLFYQLLWFPKGTPERKERCLQPSDHVALAAALDGLEAYRDLLRLPPTAYRTLLEATVKEDGASGHVVNCFATTGYLTTDPRGAVLRCQPHDFKGTVSDKYGVPWSDGVCRYLSEECICLIGHFHTELFNASEYR